jgi:hypothetical protein
VDKELYRQSVVKIVYCGIPSKFINRSKKYINMAWKFPQNTNMIQGPIFWDVVLFSLVKIYRNIRGT